MRVIDFLGLISGGAAGALLMRWWQQRRAKTGQQRPRVTSRHRGQ